MTTNARSVSNKIDSLKDVFENFDLDVALISETWLSGGRCTERNVKDLELGNSIKTLHKNRENRQGGGVAIMFDSTRTNFKKLPVKSKYELVAGLGNINKSPRKIVVLCCYLPPSLSKAAQKECMEDIVGFIGQSKTDYHDPLIYFFFLD